jgi:hypothetical protein
MIISFVVTDEIIYALFSLFAHDLKGFSLTYVVTGRLFDVTSNYHFREI